MGRMHLLYSRQYYDPVHWMYPRSVFKAAFSLVKVSWIWLATKNARSMKTVFSWGTFDAFNELLYSHHRWVTSKWPRWPLTSVLTFRILDKIESVDNIKRRKSTNIPEKTIGGLSQWFPLAFRKIVAHSNFELYFETIKVRVQKATPWKSIRSLKNTVLMVYFSQMGRILLKRTINFWFNWPKITQISPFTPEKRNIRSAGAKIRSLEFFQNLPMKSWLLIGW